MLTPPQKLHSKWRSGSSKRDLESELSSLLGYEGDLLLSAPLLVVIRAFINILLAVLQHSVDKSCEAVSHSSNGFGSAELGAQSTVLSSEISLTSD